MNLIRAGRSFYLPDCRIPGHEIKEPIKYHLHFILTDPQSDTGNVVSVPVFTYKKIRDETVILHKSDHEFIEHKSFVSYSYAGYISVKRINESLSCGNHTLQKDMSSILLKKVRDGLLKSHYTVNGIKEYCKNCFS